MSLGSLLLGAMLWTRSHRNPHVAARPACTLQHMRRHLPASMAASAIGMMYTNGTCHCRLNPTCLLPLSRSCTDTRMW
jgi:hypothetical protein